MGFQQEEQQNEKIKHFIEAINEDIVSGLHSIEGNNLLERTVVTLNSLDKYPSLSLLQVIRGCLNMMVHQLDPYDYLDPSINPKPSTEISERCLRFIKERGIWCNIKNEGLDSEEGWALILFRAAKSPLYLSARCMPNTMALYFKSLKELDSHFIPPQVPEPEGNYTVKSSNYYFEEMAYQPPATLQDFINRLSAKAYLGRTNRFDAFCTDNTNTVLRKFSDDLSTAIKTYIQQTENSSDDVWISSQKSLLRDISSTLIQQVKLSLKENWEEWLSDLFIELINQLKHFLYQCNPSATPAKFTLNERPKKTDLKWVSNFEADLISHLTPS